jgi:uncharacterized protein YdhG (YjbR/CyaY superfamily)
MAAKKAPKRKAASGGSAAGFTAEEREAMRDHARELKAARSGARAADEEEAVLARIATMAAPDRAMAERLHALIKATAPELTARLWYGMPAYSKDGKVLCFFQGSQKFKTRYSTLGFSDTAKLDEGSMWPTSFALKELTRTEEARVAALVKRASG